MILSTLLHSTLYRDVVLAAAVGNRNLGAVRSGGVPSILRLQQVIEEAWRAGFDRAGCEQLGGRLVNSRKWIGTTEVATFLWVSKGKLLPCWSVLLFSTVFNFDNSWERFVGACLCDCPLACCSHSGEYGRILQPLTGVFASWTERTLNIWISTAAEKNIMTVIEWGRVQKPGWGEGEGFPMVFEPFYFRKDAE